MYNASTGIVRHDNLRINELYIENNITVAFPNTFTLLFRANRIPNTFVNSLINASIIDFIFPFCLL